MNRDEAILAIRSRVATAFDLPIMRVHVSWDQKHQKPKVTLDPDIHVLQMTNAERVGVIQDLLEDPALDEELRLLRESMSEDELRSRLKAIRDRQDSN